MREVSMRVQETRGSVGGSAERDEPMLRAYNSSTGCKQSCTNQIEPQRKPGPSPGAYAVCET